jgi:hypothetical protein
MMKTLELAIAFTNALLQSPFGGVVVATLGVSVVYLFFGIARGILKILEPYVKRTPTKVDDQIHAAVSDALKDAEKKALDHVSDND